jgi:hypothetical protein
MHWSAQDFSEKVNDGQQHFLNSIVTLNSDYTRSEIEKRCEGTTIKENSTVLGKLQEGRNYYLFLLLFIFSRDI